MNRDNIILQHIKKEGLGIEIGPSYNPIAPKRKGYNVHIIDHLNQEQLIDKYKNHPVNTKFIEEVDFIWEGNSYASIIGKKNHYDWIIASHVIEHTPDLINFLSDCSILLKEDGILSLAIPDKRYCFDHFRPISSISSIIDNHLLKKTTHTPGTILEFTLNYVHKNGEGAWSSATDGEYEFISSLQDGQNMMNAATDSSEYIDAHAWCFVPHSFRLLIHDLYNLGMISLQEIDFFPTNGCEFYLTLGKMGQGSHLSRLAMFQEIENEMDSVIMKKKSNFMLLNPFTWKRKL